jgi:hypothetical protein
MKMRWVKVSDGHEVYVGENERICGALREAPEIGWSASATCEQPEHYLTKEAARKWVEEACGFFGAPPEVTDARPREGVMQLSDPMRVASLFEPGDTPDTLKIPPLKPLNGADNDSLTNK